MMDRMRGTVKVAPSGGEVRDEVTMFGCGDRDGEEIRQWMLEI